MDAVAVSAAPLSTQHVVAVARNGAAVSLDPGARAGIDAGRTVVDRHLAGDEPVYGLNTGIGALADTRISRDDLEQLQRNIVRSHAAGAGEALPAEVVRAMMLLRARTLSTGRSGVRVQVVERILDVLNAGITPVVPSRGSVGASGDLAQLAHIALALTGEGSMLVGNAPRPSADALREAGLEPLTLQAKEGLALINGTEGMTALGTLALGDMGALLAAADVAAAMTIEAALGTDRPFAEDLMALRPHPGQADSAANLRALLDGSAVIASHRESRHAVQDPYSMRCAPQVHGAARDAHMHARRVFEIEMASVTDNPVILPDGRVESAGNFHGEPLAYALDLLAIGATGVASISERRTFWILGPGVSRDLPPFLSTHAGLGSGYMLAQYTQAALVSECKGLAQPAGLDSIPTSGSQEDHVSMGWTSGLKLRRVLELVATVVGIELLCAAQALDLRRPLVPAAGTAAALAAIRKRVPFLDQDRDLSVDIAAATEMVRDRDVVAAVRAAAGPLL